MATKKTTTKKSPVKKTTVKKSPTKGVYEVIWTYSHSEYIVAESEEEAKKLQEENGFEVPYLKSRDFDITECRLTDESVEDFE